MPIWDVWIPKVQRETLEMGESTLGSKRPLVHLKDDRAIFFAKKGLRLKQLPKFLATQVKGVFLGLQIQFNEPRFELMNW